MVTTRHNPPVIGRLRIALANGRGLQCNADDVVDIAVALRLAERTADGREMALRKAVAGLPDAERLRAMLGDPELRWCREVEALTALAFAFLGEP